MSLGYFTVRASYLQIKAQYRKTRLAILVGGVIYVATAGADFEREYTLDSYKRFFPDAGYRKASYVFCAGRVPCAVAIPENVNSED